MSGPAWFIPPAWAGQTCFIVGGGPSVAVQPIERLRGRRVIALNSSYLAVPFADFLLFADTRWYEQHRGRREFQAFAGQRVTCSPHIHDERIWRLRRRNPPGLAGELDAVVMSRTVMAAALNMAAHLAAARIVMLGLDGQPAPIDLADLVARGFPAELAGRTHHHEPHPWPQREGCWNEQRAELATLVEPLAQRGISVVNASPNTAVDLWPVTPLEGELL
jgi:hypothetical protein